MISLQLLQESLIMCPKPMLCISMMQCLVRTAINLLSVLLCNLSRLSGRLASSLGQILCAVLSVSEACQLGCLKIYIFFFFVFLFEKKQIKIFQSFLLVITKQLQTTLLDTKNFIIPLTPLKI